MVIVTNLKTGGKVTVEIKSGAISALSYEEASELRENSRESDSKFEACLKIGLVEILESDVEKFKEIALGIKDGSPELYDYCKKIIEEEAAKYHLD